MPKTKISEFSSTPANNTDIDSINISEGCAPSGINDAIRELMAQLKDWQSGTSNDPYVVGSSGSLTLNQGTANGVAYLNGSKVVTSGTALSFDGSNLGLGVTPSAWDSSLFKAFEIPAGSLNAYQTSQINLTQNAYFTTAPTYWAYKNTAASSLYRQTGGIHSWHNAPSGTAGNAITFTQAMTLDASGQLGIGSTSPAAFVDVLKASYVDQYWRTGTVSMYVASSNSSGIGIFGTTTNHPLTFYTNGGEKARIDSSGNLLVGTTNVDPIATASNGMSYFTSNATLRIRTPATAIALGTPTSSQLQQFYYWNGSSNTLIGSISNTTTSTAYNTSSDYRLKNTIAPMTGALAKVALLKPVTYKWNADGSDGQGFISHELAEVCPDAVTGEKDAVDAEGNPKYQGIDVSFLVATLTAALQEAVAEINQLKARLDAANL